MKTSLVACALIALSWTPAIAEIVKVEANAALTKVIHPTNPKGALEIEIVTMIKSPLILKPGEGRIQTPSKKKIQGAGGDVSVAQKGGAAHAKQRWSFKVSPPEKGKYHGIFPTAGAPGSNASPGVTPWVFEFEIR